MMKLNWGHGLLITIILCTGGLLMLVWLSTRQKIDLVTEEYYPKELVYENQITKLKNTQGLTTKIITELNRDSLHLIFPQITALSDSIRGEIWFYFPADNTKDRKYRIDLTEGFIQSFDLSLLNSGKFEVLIDWKADETNYFQKEIVYYQK